MKREFMGLGVEFILRRETEKSRFAGGGRPSGPADSFGKESSAGNDRRGCEFLKKRRRAGNRDLGLRGGEVGTNQGKRKRTSV